MPAQQGLGLDEEARPVSPGQDAADRSEQRPVGRFEPGACDLAAEHGELVTQHQNLQVLGAIASGQQGEQPDRPAQRQVGDLRQHQGDLCGVMVEASQYRPQPSANSQLTSYNRVSAPHALGNRENGR